MGEELGSWRALSVEEVVTVLAGCSAQWWVAGGWAIDLHLRRQTRAHTDVDVLVLREDLPELRRCLRGWDLHAADPPGHLRPWPAQEALPAGVHDIWCRQRPEDPWQLQLMVDDTAGQEWIYRRDPRIRRSVGELSGPASKTGRAVLAPEVQLLYKTDQPRPKDEVDFHAVLPALSIVQRAWLDTALALTAPAHPWRPYLQRL